MTTPIQQPKGTISPTTDNMTGDKDDIKSTYLFKVPEDVHEIIRQSVRQNLDIGTSGHRFFNSMVSAKTFFDTRIPFFNTKSEGIFAPFTLPEYYQNKLTLKSPREDIRIQPLFYDHLSTLYDSKWLNDAVISFILKCLKSNGSVKHTKYD